MWSMPRHVITGGLGSGKTSVIEVLGRSVATVPEPARELIAEHRHATGETSLDARPEMFVERLVSRSVEGYESAVSSSVTVFDRGIPDCVAYADVFGVDRRLAMAAAAALRFDSPVFVAPPWREIYSTDDMRRATFEQAEAFFASVISVYLELEYELVELPRASAVARAAFIVTHLDSHR